MIQSIYMGMLTIEQVEEVWNRQGLKHNCKRFRNFLISRGLLPLTVPEDVFLRHMKDELLINFFVKGVVENAKGQQEYPDDSDSGSEEKR